MDLNPHLQYAGSKIPYPVTKMCRLFSLGTLSSNYHLQSKRINPCDQIFHLLHRFQFGNLKTIQTNSRSRRWNLITTVPVPFNEQQKVAKCEKSFKKLVLQICVGGSSSMCFWAFPYPNPLVRGAAPRMLLSSRKNCKKNLHSSCILTSKSNKQKHLVKIILNRHNSWIRIRR